MPELIERDALKNHLYRAQAEAFKRSEWYVAGSIQSFIDILDKQPTIEPEVRHGRMIEGRYPNENKCSECGQEFRDDIGFIIQDDDGVFHYPKRCPECGCYWDGGADNG